MDRDLSALRSVAHPLRLRILSMLTAQALSATEVASALDLTHANASYHLRVLHDAGELVVESTEKIRGGVAKRYRYRVGGDPDRPESTSAGDHIAWQHATNAEVVRRLVHRVEGRGSSADIETWVSPETWSEAMGLLQHAMVMLHEQAQPAHTDGTLHVSASSLAFVMADDS